MNKDSIKNWAGKVFVRDMNLVKNSFIYLFLSLFAIVLIAEVFIFKYLVLMEIEFAAEIEMIFLLIGIAFSFLISGWLVDIVKNKTRFFNILLLICVFGLFLNIFSESLFDFIGLIIVLITIPPLFILWFTTLIHETTILNRGRVTAILLISCFLLGLIGIVFATFEFLFNSLFIVESILLLLMIWSTRTYKYI